MDAQLDDLPDDVAALKQALKIALAKAGEAQGKAASAEQKHFDVAAELAVAKAMASDDKALIAHQALRIAKLERQVYGSRKERSAQLQDQMELQLEELEAKLNDVDDPNYDAILERFLAEYAGCVITVTHDRYFLDNVSKWILELDHGKGYPFEGNYSGWLEQKQERMRQEKKAESDRARAMGEELEWIRQSPRARQAKSKARISAYEQLVANEAEARRGVGARIHIPLTRRLGGKVIEVEGLTKAYGDKLLFENLSFKLPPGGIVGVIGANGAGKTTLFRILLGAEQPDGGKVTHGETVDLAYVDQSRDALNDNKTVWEEISGGHDLLKIGGKDVNSRAYVSLFNFTGSDQQQKVGTLSGGERRRVALSSSAARVVCAGGSGRDASSRAA